MVKAVIFDMDGVIFDSERIIIELWEEFAQENNIERMDEVTVHCIGLNDKATQVVFKEVYGEDYDYHYFNSIISKRYHELCDGGKLPMKVGVVELLSYLKENNVKVALASSTKTQTVVNQLKDANIYQYFDKVVCGDMVEKSKPEPDIFLKAAEELGINPKEAYIIEDSFNGIRAAHAAGSKPIMVPDMVQPTEEIKNLCFEIKKTLLEVRDYFKEV